MAEKIAKILLADDEEEILMVFSFYLQRANYEVILAVNGKEALEKALDENPDIALLDRMMPEMDGIEVCRRLREARPEILIVMLTAMGSDTDRIEGLEAGADDYLVKPFNPRELVLRIQALLRRTKPEPVPVKPKRSKASLEIDAPEITSAPGPKTALETLLTEQVAAEPKLKIRVPGNGRKPTTITRPSEEDLAVTIAQPVSSNHTNSNSATSDRPTSENSVQAALANNLQTTLQEANHAAQTQDISRARQLYLQVLKEDAGNESALMWLAWYTNDPYEGCDYLEQLVTAHPDNARAREFLEAGRHRLLELNQLISDSNVVNYWNVAEQVQKDRISRGVDPRPNPVQPIGQLLLRKGYINLDQLDTAVSLHEMFNRLGTPKKLGEVLLEYGYLNKEQLEAVLKEQRSDYNNQFY